ALLFLIPILMYGFIFQTGQGGGPSLYPELIANYYLYHDDYVGHDRTRLYKAPQAIRHEKLQTMLKTEPSRTRTGLYAGYTGIELILEDVLKHTFLPVDSSFKQKLLERKACYRATLKTDFID